MTELFDHPYSGFLHKVTKPNRYTGAEHGALRKNFEQTECRVCLAFPDVYDIGMSHLGFRILYKILNDDERMLAERCYTPWLDMQQQLLAHGQLLVSLENGRPLCDFDVLGFSLQFELTYTNILTMLDLGGIPLRSEHRGDDDPLIIAGGPVATHMEPIAPFLDAVLIGDGEEAAKEMVLVWVEAKRARLPRRERLARLARIPGVYVPSLYRTAIDADTGLMVVAGPEQPDLPFPIRRRLVEDLAKFPFPDDGPVGGPEAIFERMSIEIARGCTEGCRFCQAGMIYRPVRERDPVEIIETVMRALNNTGQDEVSLTALSTADVSCIAPLIEKLAEKTAADRVSLGVASLRAYGLAENTLDEIRTVRATGLTFAPEAGTQRMRDVINKNVTEAQLLETAERVFSRGFDKMKLYFIIGLPTEQDEDVLGIVEVGANALRVGKRLGRRPTVTVSVSTHVPKPHTPFQWCAQDSVHEIARKQALLRSAARKLKGLKLRMHDSEASVLEGILARGDRRLADVIERAYQRGARFDSWDEELQIEIWQEALEHFQIETARYLGTIPVSARLPWDHFDVGLEDGFLLREYRKAVRNRLSPPCGKVAGSFIHATNVRDAESERKRLVCYDCGVACDLTEMRSERIDFLKKLGAEQPVPVKEQEEHVARRGQPERYRPARSGSTPVRWRLRFEKLGPSALLGHLDLIRELPRVMRRAGLKLAYTEGYHPKPDMSYGPALALGVASLDEYIDVKIIDAPEPAQVVSSLNEACAMGLRFVEAKPLNDGEPGLSRVITAARYVIGIAETTLEPLGGQGFLEQRAAELLATETFRVRRDVGGLGKQVDVRALLQTLEVGSEAASATLRAAGIQGRLVPIEAVISIHPSGSVRLGELLQALAGQDLSYVAVRAALLAEGSSPLDLAHCRNSKRPMAEQGPIASA